MQDNPTPTPPPTHPPTHPFTHQPTPGVPPTTSSLPESVSSGEDAGFRVRGSCASGHVYLKSEKVVRERTGRQWHAAADCPRLSTHTQSNHQCFVGAQNAAMTTIA
uniref:FLYWCH-type domain-containing protein n=1 Tax=Mesocestoides corti TaxID=53468 RepID=A0A5K3EV46_MESCO